VDECLSAVHRLLVWLAAKTAPAGGAVVSCDYGMTFGLPWPKQVHCRSRLDQRHANMNRQSGEG
jgi:hypothetical protein